MEEAKSKIVALADSECCLMGAHYMVQKWCFCLCLHTVKGIWDLSGASFLKH